MKELLSTLLRRGLDEKRPAQKRFRQKTFAMGEARFNVDKALRLASELEDEEILNELNRRK